MPLSFDGPSTITKLLLPVDVGYKPTATIVLRVTNLAGVTAVYSTIVSVGHRFDVAGCLIHRSKQERSIDDNNNPSITS